MLAKLAGSRTELVGLRRDGGSFPMNVAVSRVRHGDQTSFTAVVRDVTREHELDQMKSDFVSTISHEIRTPLVSIIQSAKILRKNGESRPNVTPRFAGIIVQEGERLTRLINDILDLSKIDSGKTEWSIADEHVDGLISRVTALARARAEEYGIELRVDIEEGLPLATVDADKIVQVLTNLVDNALKFTEREGTVTVRATRHDDDFVRIEVQDDGVGMDSDDAPKVFERFKQIGDVMTDKPHGTGLGLSICKEIVEYLGGSIWAESEAGAGSTFQFTVRASSVMPSEEIATSSLEDSWQIDENEAGVSINTTEDDATDDRPRVLVVDDDKAARKVVSYLLEANGMRVERASCGKDAIQIATSSRPDLVVLDVLMPGLSGYEVLKALRLENKTKDLPVLLLSVLQDRELSEHARTLGADACLSKPVDDELLLGTVRRLLNRESREVLLVSDDSKESSEAKSKLAAQGYTVLQAFDVRTALTIAQRVKPSLFVVGARVAGGPTDDVIDQIREDDELGSVPVVILADSTESPENQVFFEGDHVSAPSAKGDMGRLLTIVGQQHETRENLEAARDSLRRHDDDAGGKLSSRKISSGGNRDKNEKTPKADDGDTARTE